MFSLEQRVQPATMIRFKQIEFFDHTALALGGATLENLDGNAAGFLKYMSSSAIDCCV